MPQNNPRLTPDQKVAALCWVAACEKLDHFLCGTPGYPELKPEEVVHMLDTTESAFHELRRSIEASSRSTPP
jgi:hypothetical protein